jgi:hypothetical protein
VTTPPPVTLPDLAARMATKLRLHCRCRRDYDMKVVDKCSVCELIEQYEALVAIDQTAAPKPGSSESKG